jgi:hypothetical protein
MISILEQNSFHQLKRRREGRRDKNKERKHPEASTHARTQRENSIKKDKNKSRKEAYLASRTKTS